MIKKRWQQIKRRIIKRQAPHAILSWRYFLPNQSEAVKLHRRTFLKAWPQYPRIVWFLIALYSYPLWYFFYSWRQIARVWTKRSVKLQRQESISRRQQLFSILSLALLHSTPPAFYYQYRLYRYPESEWLDFIYTHELPHWHLVMSPKISERTHRLMSHKDAFSVEMAKVGLPGIPTLHILEKNEQLTEARVFCQQSLFFKPEQGSRKKGCFELSYDSAQKSYQLKGLGKQAITTQSQIKEAIDRQVHSQRYLVQPLLKNHALLEVYYHSLQLVTIRLITTIVTKQSKAISGMLEIPIEGSFNNVYSIDIQLKDGALNNMDRYYSLAEDAQIQNILKSKGLILPFWSELVLTAEQAHQQFLDIVTIGWDLAITEQGVVLLEGNVNWGVAVHQYDKNNLIQALIANIYSPPHT